jgi:hypothetical protein
MTHKITQFILLALIAITFSVIPVFAAGLVGDAVRNPLLDAENLANQCDYKAAIAKIEEADAVSNKSPIEGAAIASAKRYIALRAASSAPGCPQWNVRLPVLSDAFLLKVPVNDFLTSCAKDTTWPSNCTRTVTLTTPYADFRSGKNICLSYLPDDVANEAAVDRKLGA